MITVYPKEVCCSVILSQYVTEEGMVIQLLAILSDPKGRRRIRYFQINCTGGGDGGFDLHFLPHRRKKIDVAASLRTGVSNMPPAYCTAKGSNPYSPSPTKQKTRSSMGGDGDSI